MPFTKNNLSLTKWESKRKNLNLRWSRKEFRTKNEWKRYWFKIYNEDTQGCDKNKKWIL